MLILDEAILHCSVRAAGTAHAHALQAFKLHALLWAALVLKDGGWTGLPRPSRGSTRVSSCGTDARAGIKEGQYFIWKIPAQICLK